MAVERGMGESEKPMERGGGGVSGEVQALVALRCNYCQLVRTTAVGSMALRLLVTKANNADLAQSLISLRVAALIPKSGCGGARQTSLVPPLTPALVRHHTTTLLGASIARFSIHQLAEWGCAIDTGRSGRRSKLQPIHALLPDYWGRSEWATSGRSEGVEYAFHNTSSQAHKNCLTDSVPTHGIHKTKRSKLYFGTFLL